MNVLQISHDYGGPFTAICRQYNDAFEGHSVTTVYLRGARDSRVEAATGGQRVVFFEQADGTLRGIKFVSIFRLAALFREARFDVVIAHRYKSIYLAGIMSYFFPIRLLLGVAHEHNVFRRPTRSLFLSFWRPDIVVIAVSETVREDVANACGSLTREGRLHKLYNAIDIGARESRLVSREDARDALGLPQSGWVYGTIGRLIAKKDQDVLIRSFAALATTDARLALVGGGARLESLQVIAGQSGVIDRVRFSGHVPEAWRYLRAFDAFVFSSGEEEAFGLVLLEAMMARIPIVCSNAPGPREVIGDHGLCFDVRDEAGLTTALARMRDLPEARRHDMTAAAYDRLRTRFSQKVLTARLWAIPQLAALAPPETATDQR